VHKVEVVLVSASGFNKVSHICLQIKVNNCEQVGFTLYRTLLKYIFVFMLVSFLWLHFSNMYLFKKNMGPARKQTRNSWTRAEYYWPVHLVWMTARHQQDTFLSWHLAPASEKGHGLIIQTRWTGHITTQPLGLVSN
jgi:hypothetical protein